MRLIYVDEAGTGPAEPVRVVASVIVDADNQMRELVSEMERIFDEKVPPPLREGFIFHAKQIFNPAKKRIDYEDYVAWAFEDRLDFIKEIVCLPFVHDVPIGLAICFRGIMNISPEDKDRFAKLKISVAALEHATAFSRCLERSDHFLRNYLEEKEVGVVICEDVNEKEKLLLISAFMFKNPVFNEGPGDFLQTRAEKVLCEPAKRPIYDIANIIDVPHFVNKSGAPLLQLADACAFSFRRYLSRQKYGDEFVLAMLGPGRGQQFISDDVWFSGMSSGLFNTERYWTEEQRRAAEFFNRRVNEALSASTFQI